MRHMGRGIGRLGMVLLAVVAVGLAPAGPVSAAMLAEAPEAMPDWRGTVTSDLSCEGSSLIVELDYAVFLPGDYGGSDPSGGSEYVYAYQVFNTDSSTVGICVLTIGLDPLADAGNIGHDLAGPGEAGGVCPDLCVISPTSASARWAFGWVGGSEIGVGEHSAVLLFTSPDEPKWSCAVVADGGLPVPAGTLPSPVPEPTSLLLLVAGALAAHARRRRH